MSIEIRLEDVETMSHFGVIRNWIIKMKSGDTFELSADVVEKIVQHENEELGYLPVVPVQHCSYCGKKPDGAMLSIGNSMAHAGCVIQRLNELLDPDYEGTGKPNEIIGFLAKFEPAQLEVPLKALWDNDDTVPTPYSGRCSGLDWFSSGIKNNVVAYIAIKVMGKDKAEKVLGQELDNDLDYWENKQ